MRFMRHLKLSLIICFAVLLFVIKTSVVNAASASVTVNIKDTVGPISKNIWGVDFQSFINISPPNATNFFGTYIDQVQLAALGAKMYRFPGGCAADYYDWKTGQLVYNTATGPVTKPYLTLDDALTIAATSNGLYPAEILYQVNINDLTLPNTCGATSQLGKTRATLLQEIRDLLNDPRYLTQPLTFELGNEQWYNWDPAEYQSRAVEFARAMKTINPNIKIGVIGYPGLAPASDPKKDPWNQMIKSMLTANVNCGTSGNLICFDFVSDHQYPRAKHTSNFVGMAAYYPITNLSNQLPTFQQTFTGQKYSITEWNLACADNPTLGLPVPMAKTVDQGLFTFTSLFVMAQNKVNMANFHDLSVNSTVSTNYGCGLFTNFNTFSAAGQAFSLSAPAAGGELINTQNVFATNVALLCIPANAGCTDADCIKASPSTCTTDLSGAYSTMSSYAVKQGNDLYVFLVNRNDATAADPLTLNAIISYPIWTGYDKTVVMDLYSGASYTSQSFQLDSQTLYNQNSGKIQALLPPTSIARIRILDHFVGAPAATPTQSALPSNNFQIIKKLINMKREPVNKCSQDILMYVIASAVYIMVIHFAIAINEDFKMHLLITTFVISGALGYYVCSLDIGFVLGVVLSLFLW